MLYHIVQLIIYMCIYVYMYICTYVCMCIYIYIYIYAHAQALELRDGDKSRLLGKGVLKAPASPALREQRYPLLNLVFFGLGALGCLGGFRVLPFDQMVKDPRLTRNAFLLQ